MSSNPERDIEIWISTKLEDPWSSEKFTTYLTPPVLKQIQARFPILDTSIKLRLLFAFLHARKNTMKELESEFNTLISLGTKDPDDWVKTISKMLSVLRDGDIQLQTEGICPQDVHNSLKDSIKEQGGVKFYPQEALFLNKSLVGAPPTSISHFTLKKPLVSETSLSVKKPSLSNSIPKLETMTPGTVQHERDLLTSSGNVPRTPAKKPQPTPQVSQERRGFQKQNKMRVLEIQEVNMLMQQSADSKKRKHPQEIEEPASEDFEKQKKKKEKQEQIEKKTKEKEEKKRKKMEEAHHKKLQNEEKKNAVKVVPKKTTTPKPPKKNQKEGHDPMHPASLFNPLGNLPQYSIEAHNGEQPIEGDHYHYMNSLYSKQGQESHSKGLFPPGYLTNVPHGNLNLHPNQGKPMEFDYQGSSYFQGSYPMSTNLPPNNNTSPEYSDLPSSSLSSQLSQAILSHQTLRNNNPPNVSQSQLQQPIPTSPQHTSMLPPNLKSPTYSPPNPPYPNSTGSISQIPSQQLNPVPSLNLFEPANRLTPENKQKILQFLSGNRENPSPKDGAIQTFLLDEQVKEANNANCIESVIFEINYEAGTWRKLRRKRFISRMSNPNNNLNLNGSSSLLQPKS